VSTFQDHSATPAARVAARSCFSFQTGIGMSFDGCDGVTVDAVTGLICESCFCADVAMAFSRYRRERGRVSQSSTPLRLPMIYQHILKSGGMMP